MKITNCARCGGDHGNVEHRMFTRPTGRHNGFATCPTTGEPVLFITFHTDTDEDARGKLAEIQRLEAELLAMPCMLAPHEKPDGE